MEKRKIENGITTIVEFAARDLRKGIDEVLRALAEAEQNFDSTYDRLEDCYDDIHLPSWVQSVRPEVLAIVLRALREVQEDLTRDHSELG